MDLIEAKEKKYGDIITTRHPWETARLDVLKKIISNYSSLKSGSIVLDIGCGDTFVVENIAKDYPNVIFYAVDTAFTSHLLEKYRRSMSVKNVFLYPSLDDFEEATNAQVSLVILTDVIEHIENDKQFISELLQRRSIANNTLFFITVPAYQSLFCSHDRFLGHYRRYTNELLKDNLSFAGLTVITTGYFFFCLVPIRILQVLKEKVIGFNIEKISTGLAQWDENSVVSFILKKLLTIDTTFSFFLKKIGINLPGLSNYAICKKSV